LRSEHDLLSVSLVNSDPEYIKHEFDQFLTECPPPIEENLQQLTDLTDSIENVWTKENAVFAYNRVLEIKERFQYYYKILEEQIAEKKELERREEESRRELMKKSRKVVRAVDSLLTTVSGEGEGNDVFLESQEMSVEMGYVPPDLDSLPAVKSVDDRPHPEKTESQLSLYYDADIDKALKLLESTAQRASFEGAVDIGVTEGPESVDFETGLLPPQEEHRLSKQDISSPTATVGALFTEGGEEINLAEEEPDIESRVSYHKFIIIFSIKAFFHLTSIVVPSFLSLHAVLLT